jgi:hypothetical protein
VLPTGDKTVAIEGEEIRMGTFEEETICEWMAARTRPRITILGKLIGYIIVDGLQ